MYQDFLTQKSVKGEALQNMPPENSEDSIKAAFKAGYGVEIDVVKTKDNDIIITHTNSIMYHSSQALPTDNITEKTLAEIKKLKTGLGGQTRPFLTYDKFIELLKKHPDCKANIEIKGALNTDGIAVEPRNPSIVDILVKKTPKRLLKRIIWSSFAASNLREIKNKLPQSNIAQLYMFPYTEEPYLYSDTNDIAMQFTKDNIEKTLEPLPELNAVHPSIDSLNEEALQLCIEKKLGLRCWFYMEKNPAKDRKAKQFVLKLIEFQKNNPSMEIDLITDFADEIKNILLKHKIFIDN
jgi:glycerophosphoryl diester phosphodiesterase